MFYHICTSSSTSTPSYTLTETLHNVIIIDVKGDNAANPTLTIDGTTVSYKYSGNRDSHIRQGIYIADSLPAGTVIAGSTQFRAIIAN